MATSAQVIEAIKAAQANGWTVVDNRFCYLVTSPASDVDHPTPANWPKNWWPAATFRKLFQLVVIISPEGRVTFAETRTCESPGGAVREQKVSFTRAIEFLRADHGAE